MSRRLLSFVAAAALSAAALTAPLAPAAQAAACTGAEGVTVVVDFAELGGGVTAGCADVADGTRGAAAIAAAGYSLTRATRQPGFVCRVNGAPASDPCVEAAPAHAYWALWWADGDGGGWVYSSRGVDSLRVPAGGYVALSWHQGSGRSQPPATVPVDRSKPAVKPTSKPTPKPTQQPSGKPTTKPSQKPADATGSKPDSEPKSRATTPAATTAPDEKISAEERAAARAERRKAKEREAKEKKAEPTPTGTPSPGETVAVAPTLVAADEITAGPETVQAEPTSADSNSMPVWVPLLLVGAVVAAGGVAVVRRRRA